MQSALEQLPNTYRPFFGRFAALTSAQKALIQPILQGRDVILQAGTGSGKTEGVLAPASEKLLTHPTHFTILYIVPTRALALDMHRRIQPLYRILGLKSGIRTGDGKTLQDAMPHLLILTPESLDVLLGSQNADNQHFLKHLKIFIIDEVHLFLHTLRGQHLSYLRHRLEKQTKAHLQTITLSATLSAPQEVAAFFALHNVFYYNQTAGRTLHPRWVHLKHEEEELPAFFDDLSRRFGCQKLLVFANSRKACEKLYTLLTQKSAFSHPVLLHYSNLSTKERRCIENAFRQQNQAICIATSTLEVGIDVGDVDGVVLMGPPPTTTAFLQRIGRANRREQHVNIWGICHGAHAEQQLIRFLALFECAQECLLEKHSATQYVSVLFQQVLSCLYAKKVVSEKSLTLLFPQHAHDLHAIFQGMVENNWLKSMPQAGLFFGGWRYLRALKEQQIWSNFPSTEVEYDVILEEETLAVLPLSTVRQLEIGSLIQLTGKVLKILKIEEKLATREVIVEETQDLPDKELLWAGFGLPISFEVAQKMGSILLGSSTPQGLLHRTEHLLHQARKRIKHAPIYPNGIAVHAKNGCYRYDTFWGSIGNFILHHLIKKQFGSRIEGLFVQFDELGVECNVWISLHALELPDTPPKFQQWVASHLPLLKTTFSWNHWLHALPEEQQEKEILSHLLDLRILKQFSRCREEVLQKPSLALHTDPVTPTHPPLFTGAPWSLENERQSWGKLFFPDPPKNATDHAFTATQLQGYIEHQFCPRYARFQHLSFTTQSHPRFCHKEQERRAKQEESTAFEEEVIEHLQKGQRLCSATAEWTWKEALKEVITSQTSLFLVRATLEIESFKGRPDLIYCKYAGSHLHLEVWEIKNRPSCSYAQKWQVAFYAHLLTVLLQSEVFELPVLVSKLGGILHRPIHSDNLFDRTAFHLVPYERGMARLIAQWQKDASQTASAHTYSLDSHCTSCSYFSYCYQEALFKETKSPASAPATPMALEVESNDFPKNTKQWFFLHYTTQRIHWQCWENQEVHKDAVISLEEHTSRSAFQQAVIKRLHKEWHAAIDQGKNPHILVYAPADWHAFQQAFQSTSLRSLWAMHACSTSIQTVLKTHFTWQIHGELTPSQVGRCLGLTDLPHPLSLYHRESPEEVGLDLYRHIWNWILSHVHSRRVVRFDAQTASTASTSLVHHYLAVEHREKECHTHAILEFQNNPLPIRVEQFRAIGPCTLLETKWQGNQKANKTQKSYLFSIDSDAPVSKFRVGDFLKLSPVGSMQIQEGASCVLTSYSPQEKRLAVRPIEQKVLLNPNIPYALDENAEDWNGAKIAHILHRFKNPKFKPKLQKLLLGSPKPCASNHTHWVKQWYQTHSHQARLNPLQQQALMLPFEKNIGLIEGPPGTGKTHLLVWTLLALIAHAHASQRSIKILVTAQTHQAIDQILIKIAEHLPPEQNLLWKYGRYDQAQFSQLNIRPLQLYAPLDHTTSLILGATGFGIYQLLEGKQFPELFDWIIFDEASQVLPSYALLSLVFGKGNALFFGDTQQLPPVLKGCYDHHLFTPQSILQELIGRYPQSHRIRLNETYRMNEEICNFASNHWYEGELRSAVPKTEQRVRLPNYPLFHDLLDTRLNPSEPMVVVELDHEGCRESSAVEASWIASAVKRLMCDYRVPSEEIGIIAPHRLQANTIACALKEGLAPSYLLPKIDTVERMQGLEFDIVFFSATVSDKEIIHSAFLKDYRRFNVTLTRARKKMFFVASRHFFHTFPLTEQELIAHLPFEDFFAASSSKMRVTSNTKIELKRNSPDTLFH